MFTWTHKRKTKPEWEKVFAWTPKPIGDVSLQNDMKMVWLCWVERKFIGSYGGTNSYEYREIVEY